MSPLDRAQKAFRALRDSQASTGDSQTWLLYDGLLSLTVAVAELREEIATMRGAMGVTETCAGSGDWPAPN